MNDQRMTRFVVLWCLFLLPTAVSAQTVATGSIAGVVRDTSGAVLPGVTVEAASPALIEKVRSVTADEKGQYKIVDLRPGTYSVTFSLPGFGTVKRDGIELTTAFTATVNVELNVGSIEETVTVSGQASVVDTQNVMQNKTLARTTLDAMPIGQGTASYAAIIPGAVANAQDVGGTMGVTNKGHRFAVHGGRDTDIMVTQDGIQRNNRLGGAATGLGMNTEGIQEVTIQTGGISAEASVGGAQVNVVPKDGGNTFSGQAEFKFANGSLQGKNVNAQLLARGLDPARPGLKVNSFMGGGLGGPIRKDKLWFYASVENWNVQQWVPGVYWNASQGTLRYTPDLTRPAFDWDYYKNVSLRLTWQATPKQKFSLHPEYVLSCTCVQGIGTGTMAPEATQWLRYIPDYTARLTWSYPMSNRLLFEAGGGPMIVTQAQFQQKGVAATDIQVTELSNGFVFNSVAQNLTSSGNYGEHSANQLQGRFSMAYVTGSHAFKTGFTTNVGWKDFDNHINGGLDYSVRNGIPSSLREWVQPHRVLNRNTELGLYTQDQWTIRKLTLNMGVRFDYLNGHVPAEHLDAGPLVPARDLPEVSDVPNWKDIAPRVGAAYDVFGDGKTAIKAFLGRYVALESLNGYSSLNSPANLMVVSATRTWADSNGNAVPDCDLRNTALNGECGQLSNSALGQTSVNTRYADDVLTGFRRRNSNWQGSVSFQHELLPRVAVDVGYFRTWFNNFTVTDNVLVAGVDYDPYCITAPVDSRLPGGGGNQLCGLYDIKSAKFGQVSSLVTQASNYGTQTQVYNGIDVTFNARFGKGGILSGGLSAGRTVTDNCFVVDSPQQARPGYCHVSPPLSVGTQVKFLAVYPLPWDLQTSATFQNLPGLPVTASYVATNAQIAPSLGRNLAQGANGTATIDIIPPGTMFEDRLNQVDLRLSRTFKIGPTKIQVNIDVFNLFNASTILSTNTRFGAQWLQPTQILGAHSLRLGAQLTF